MDNDFHPFYARVGDTWTKIDYSKPAETWMKPLVRGEETDLVEIRANWYLDDLPPMMFIKKAPNSHGFVNPRHLEEIWRDQFDWVYREYDYAVFPITIHPDVCGRPQVLLMLERLIEYINGHDGVRWATFEEIADDFAQRYPRDASWACRSDVRQPAAAARAAAGSTPRAERDLQQDAGLRRRPGRRRRALQPPRGPGRRRARTRACTRPLRAA